MTELALFVALALLALLAGLKNLFTVIKEWKSLWDGDLTLDDAKLASSAAFYLLIPPTVLLHELGHAIAVWSVGLEVTNFWFLGYMGAVFHPPSTDLGNFAIALAGNVVTLVIGFGCIAYGLLRPGHPVRNILWIDLGRQSLVLVLILYPLLCVPFPGDFRSIYDFAKTPLASGITAAMHALILVTTYRVLWPRIKSRARLLCSNQAPALIAAEAKLARDPEDLTAHAELGRRYFVALDFARARRHLEPLVERGRLDAQLRLTYGTVLLEHAEYERAIPYLEQAKQSLLRPEDREAAEGALELAKAKVVSKRQ